MGPLYPAHTPQKEREAESSGEEAHYASYNLTVVNDMFQEMLADEEEEGNRDPEEAAKEALLPFFAFSESPSSGHLLTVDTRSGYVMVLDVTKKSGPWIAGESFDDFLKRLSEGEKAAPPPAEDREEEEEGEGDMEEDEEEEGDLYCCDQCMAELGASEVRFHCQTCENYDLCKECYEKAKAAAAAAAASADSSSSSSSQKKHLTPEDSQHPDSHEFNRIEPTKAGKEEEEEEEKQ
jgi:hypothetical protein